LPIKPLVQSLLHNSAVIPPLPSLSKMVATKLAVHAPPLHEQRADSKTGCTDPSSDAGRPAAADDYIVLIDDGDSQRLPEKVFAIWKNPPCATFCAASPQTFRTDTGLQAHLPATAR